jgi:hypothetical protein
MAELIDTLMNLFVFAFVGLLVWLYFKEPHSDRQDRDNGSRQGD